MMRRALIASLLLFPLVFASLLLPVSASPDNRSHPAASVWIADSGEAADHIERLSSATQLCSAPSFHAVNATALASRSWRDGRDDLGSRPHHPLFLQHQALLI